MAITPTTTTNIFDTTGVSPVAAAAITVGTVVNPVTGVTSNVESTFFFLRGATAATYGGAIEVDYSVGANGALTALQQIVTQPNLNTVATYYGPEQANPILAAELGGLAPANPSYAYTQYTYVGGTLSQVVVGEPNGKIFLGT